MKNIYKSIKKHKDFTTANQAWLSQSVFVLWRPKVKNVKIKTKFIEFWNWGFSLDSMETPEERYPMKEQESVWDIPAKFIEKLGWFPALICFVISKHRSRLCLYCKTNTGHFEDAPYHLLETRQVLGGICSKTLNLTGLLHNIIFSEKVCAALSLFAVCFSAYNKKKFNILSKKNTSFCQPFQKVKLKLSCIIIWNISGHLMIMAYNKNNQCIRK